MALRKKLKPKESFTLLDGTTVENLGSYSCQLKFTKPGSQNAAPQTKKEESHALTKKTGNAIR